MTTLNSRVIFAATSTTKDNKQLKTISASDQAQSASVRVNLTETQPIMNKEQPNADFRKVPMPHTPGEKHRMVNIAIALGLTTRKQGVLEGDRIPKQMPFFLSLMPSFCKTCSPGYNYSFFVAHDQDDTWFTQPKFVQDFTKYFFAYVEKNCTRDSMYSLHLIACQYNKKVAWSQNDAVIEAYLSGMDYFYRINDDTIMVTANWTESFMAELFSMSPPRVGVVGPTHQRGNMRDLTYDFTHKTHLEIFGFYYPRCFVDWDADVWITRTYLPGRSVKLPNVHLLHTQQKGKRYQQHSNPQSIINAIIDKGKDLIARWVNA